MSSQRLPSSGPRPAGRQTRLLLPVPVFRARSSDGLWCPIIPSLLTAKPISGDLTFNNLHRAGIKDAGALVKAARLYQQAVWLCDTDPSFSWLQLVGAVEVVANRWSIRESDDEEVLRNEKPDLVNQLEEMGCSQAVSVIAEEFAQTMRATTRFIQFSLAHLPPEPAQRPPELVQVEWSEPKFRAAFKKIYKYRSRALHYGVRFPEPMCECPFRHEEWSTWEERPTAGATHFAGATWVREDIPMHLWVYEQLVRHSIWRWWSLVVSGTNEP